MDRFLQLQSSSSIVQKLYSEPEAVAYVQILV